MYETGHALRAAAAKGGASVSGFGFGGTGFGRSLDQNAGMHLEWVSTEIRLYKRLQKQYFSPHLVDIAMIWAMKPIIFLLCAFLLIDSCRKNAGPIDNGPGDPVDTLPQPPKDTHLVPLGCISILKNGEIWSPKVNSGYDRSDSAFSIFGEKTVLGLNETFGLVDIPLKLGKFPFEHWPNIDLFPNQQPEGSLSLFYDGDQGIGSYKLDTTRTDHFIEVLHYDALAHTVEGRFQVFLKMYKKPNWIPPGIGPLDTVAAFTEGKYYLKLQE